jgi:predicted nuclease with TOPRIM domain
MKHIEERLESLNKNYFVLEEEVKKLQDEKSKSQHHYTYLENEIKIARAENLHFSSELETKTKILEQYTEKLRRYEQQ